MTCQCGKEFGDVYYKDWPDLCPLCARIEMDEFNCAWWGWFRRLSPQQKREYMNNGPYTPQQVKDFIFKTE